MATIITTDYKGDGQCTLIHGPTGDTVVTDLPPDNGGKGRCFSPTDLFTASLSSCILTIMGEVAKRDGIEFVGSKIEIEKIMNENPRRVKKFILKISFATSVEKKHQKKLIKCIESCPVHKSLHPDIEMEVEIH
ncbi:MAG: OsmC family protein [Bacteriovoracaceae bacterium]|nr:OsmC family protein [Bacteriovoracaceae bacterium]